MTYPTNLHLLIEGERIAAGDRATHKVLNPASGETLAELPLATAADLDRALEICARAYRVWRGKSADERGSVLMKAAALIRSRADEIATLATTEQGKPIGEAKGELGYTAALTEWFAAEAKRAYGRVLVRPAGQRSMVVKEPIGPAVAFCPWNFPILNPVRKIAPALAAGCAIIVKPAEETPATALAVADCFIEAGVPDGVVQVVFGVPDQVSRHLLGSRVVRKMSFTGSVPVGKQLMRLAADNAIRTTMELGGHGPVLVFDDCDLDRTVATLVAGKVRNAGQVCISPTRFYVQEGIYDRFVAAYVERTAKVAVGDGAEAGTQMGPLANSRRPEAIAALVEDAKRAGATVALGGERDEGNGFFYRPTVLTDVPLEARAMNEEPFGPLSLMRPFRDPDEAVEQANRLPFGLAAYCFTENLRRANLVADAIESGMVGINTMQMSAVDAPFGGVKDSGHGWEDGAEGMEAFMTKKAVHIA